MPTVDHDVAWELDRQVTLTQLQNLILALRSSARFSSKSRFFGNSQQAAEHPLLQGAIDLRSRLLSGARVVVPAPGSSSSSLVTPNHVSDTTGEVSAAAAVAQECEGWCSPYAPAPRPLTEDDVLAPFFAVCRSLEASETILSVAISGKIAILRRPCAFITVKGILAALEAATAARRDTASSRSHEVLMARLVQAYVACVRHPAAVELPEAAYVRVVSRTLVLALRPETSPLLKRTAESAMNTMVSLLYTRAVGAAEAEGGGPSALPTHPHRLDGVSMMCYISRLISGEVTSLDKEGNALVPVGRTDAPRPAREGAGPSLREQGGGGGEQARPTRAPVAVVTDSGHAIQLEGLWLAQAALFAIGHHLSNDGALRLRAAVQNDLSRALLIAGVATRNVVVLSQILRTVHIAVKCAARYLVPQMLSFLRVLHLGPLAALTDELDRAGLTSSPQRYGSPPPTGSLADPRGSPLRGPASPTSGGVYRTSAQLMDLCERREVVLESLAELCSDPGFLLFCCAHYDLAWHTPPMLPQLCDALVNSTHVSRADAEGRDGGEGGHSPSRSTRSSEGRGGGDSPLRGQELRPVNRLQLVALDAAVNMVSEVALRTLRAQASSGRDGGGGCGAVPAPSSPLARASVPLAFPSSLSRSLVAAAVGQMAAQKKLLMSFAELFDESPLKKGLPFLLEHAVRVDTDEDEAAAAREHRTWLLLRRPAGGYEVGQALYRLSVLLNKRTLGDHIGDLGRDRTVKPAAGEMVVVRPDGSVAAESEQAAALGGASLTTAGAGAAEGQGDQAVAAANGEPGHPAALPPATTLVPALELWERARAEDHLVVGTIRFYEEQLKGFIGMFDFRGKPLLTAIREMVYRLCLPGESQKIDRIMEAFAKHWFRQNEGLEHVNPFHCDSGAFVLSFAIIMLNTTLHSKRLDRVLTLADFKSMNRGIDDGNNVPDEYLADIYDDVQRHEVIMSEMMDRGFANDTTWELEMSGVQMRSFHGVDGTLTNMLSLMCEDAHTPATDPHSDADSVGKPGDGDAARVATPTVAADAGLVTQVLEPIVFETVWKRCLLVFTGMMEAAGVQVARLNPRGVTIQDATELAQALMPTEVAALTSSLRGMRMLSQAAYALGAYPVADQCMLALLPHVSLELSAPQDVVDGVYRSLPKLLCAREIFTLVRTTAAALSDSWPLLADFVVKLYLLGFLAMPSPTVALAEAASLASSTARTVGNASTSTTTTAAAAGGGQERPAIPGVLSVNPGVVEGGATAAAKRNDSSSSGGGGGGWFASFFGSSNNGSGGGARDGSDEAADVSTVTDQPRVRECIPTMEQLLRVFAASPAVVRRGFIQGLTVHPLFQPPRPTTTQEAFALSHAMCLAVAVALAVGGAPDSAETVEVVDVLRPHLQSAVLRTLEAAAAVRGSGRSRSGPPAFNPAGMHWASAADRVTAGVLSVARYAVMAHGGRSAWASMSGAGLPMAVERVVTVYLDLPPVLFTAHAALPTAQLLEAWATAVAAAGVGDAASWGSLAPLAVRTAGMLSRAASPAAVTAVCRACSAVVAHSLYEPARDAESLADAALTLGVIRGQQDMSRGEGGTTAAASPLSAPRRGPGAGSVAEEASPTPGMIIGTCAHAVLQALRADLATGTSSEATATAWVRLWIACIRRLGGLVVYAGAPRTASESLLSLQRALQDTALTAEPASVVQSIYDEVLFPLVELVCAPGSAAGFVSSTPPPTSAGEAVLGPVAALLEWTSPPPSPMASRGSPVPAAHLPPMMAAEVKCRVVNLLPKVLLQYTDSLAAYPELLQDLWQRVLGTLYAMYTAYPPAAGAEGGAAGEGAGESGELLSDEAGLMREAVEETVKNMVYVVSAMDTGANSVFARVPFFLTSTRNLVRPFAFAEPLLAFLDSVDPSREGSPLQ